MLDGRVLKARRAAGTRVERIRLARAAQEAEARMEPMLMPECLMSGSKRSGRGCRTEERV